MADLMGGHITLDHMYDGMQEHDPGRTNVVCYLWIANCSVTSLHVTLARWGEQRFIKVHHETLMSERTHKRLNVLVVVYSAPSIRNKKPLNNISVPFIHSLWWKEPFHVLFPAFAFAIVCDDTQYPLAATFCWTAFLPDSAQGKQDLYCARSFLSLGQCLSRDPSALMPSQKWNLQNNNHLTSLTSRHHSQ